MNILFTVALNEKTEFAKNYKSIMQLFRDFAITLEKLGHRTYILSHPDAVMHSRDYRKVYVTKTFTNGNYRNIARIVGFKPDYTFIWNGNLECDKQTIDILKANKIKIVYGELGFFKHYDKTCYFDTSGVNCRVSDIGKPISSEKLTEDESKQFLDLINQNIKPKLFDKPFIFVPLQVETDTQITKYSPFKTMDELIEYVNDIFQKDNRPILFKQHPMKKSLIKEYPKFIEVTEDVHHYIPYADVVIGINSTVMIETMLYHDRIVNLGAGISSRHFINSDQRKRYILNLYNKQMNWSDLYDRHTLSKTNFYKELSRNNL